MYLSTSTSTLDFSEMYLSTFRVLYKLYLSTYVLKYKVLLPGFDSYTTKPDGKRQDAVGTLTITPQKSDQARSIRCDVRNSAMNFPKWTEAHLEVLCKCGSTGIVKGVITRNLQMYLNSYYRVVAYQINVVV